MSFMALLSTHLVLVTIYWIWIGNGVYEDNYGRTMDHGRNYIPKE